jgi:hypothetical protein
MLGGVSSKKIIIESTNRPIIHGVLGHFWKDLLLIKNEKLWMSFMYYK